jgi:phosphoribosylformylglycinamidine (FGAM) synthase PurS component
MLSNKYYAKKISSLDISGNPHTPDIRSSAFDRLFSLAQAEIYDIKKKKVKEKIQNDVKEVKRNLLLNPCLDKQLRIQWMLRNSKDPLSSKLRKNKNSQFQQNTSDIYKRSS